jgi:hypothetical protein
MVFAFLSSISRAVYSAHSLFLILLYHYLINTKNYATRFYTGLSPYLKFQYSLRYPVSMSPKICTLPPGKVRINVTLRRDSHIACRSPDMPCRKRFRMCLSHLIYTVRPCLIHTCHAMPMPCSDHAVLLKATAQHGRLPTAVLWP